jgi:hypothetical protein
MADRRPHEPQERESEKESFLRKQLEILQQQNRMYEMEMFWMDQSLVHLQQEIKNLTISRGIHNNN